MYLYDYWQFVWIYMHDNCELILPVTCCCCCWGFFNYNHHCREMCSFYVCTCQFSSLFSWKSKSNVWHSSKGALTYSSSQFFLKTKLVSWTVKLRHHFCSRIPVKCLLDTTRYHLSCPTFFSTVQTDSNGLYSSWSILWVILVWKMLLPT